ncbi:hypothetical protein GCM10010112_55240 [Actinoplanes lobatus]|uniref:DUF402 domain-containing protein n=1 Tax=Actinoplanes lobatus TaxID=113568 RepID=A0ABQ4AGR6_9ACTN|nr:hypothetical protein GCM10010112_55240 [Actinoplanes lobatus]GIE40197.1 hypothetical protein Alo02nite_30950 [Actinoplanes lobatus]
MIGPARPRLSAHPVAPRLRLVSALVDRVELVLRKYDGRPHRSVTGLLLGDDEHGTWIGTPRGSVVRFSYGASPVEHTRHDAVRLIPHDGWWMAMFLAEPSAQEVYCDVTTPAEHSPGRITVVDLDIDVTRSRPDGRVLIEDEDEFEAHRRELGYPPEVVTQATAAATHLRDALTGADEPFGTHALTWMTRLGATPPRT